jgi:cytochrome c oxidase assembly protein subunit 15
MIHRYAATTLGFVIVLITAIAIAYRRERPASTLRVVAARGGGAARAPSVHSPVWWLDPLVVVLHLIGGLTTLGLLTWLWLGMRRVTRVVEPAPGATKIAALDGARRAAAVAATVIVAFQIMLGGWTSSNYAAVACP